MSDLSNDVVIDDKNCDEFLASVSTPDSQFARGLKPRDYSKIPLGDYADIKPFNLPLIPRHEWSSRIKDMEQSQSRLSDLRDVGNNGQQIPSLDQNGQGFCWCYSTAGCVTLVRARDNQPYVRFSPHAIACKMTGWKDRGGWGCKSLDYWIKYGCPTVETWPEKSMSRNYDTAATWAEAAKHQIVGAYVDITPSVYDRRLTADQHMTLLLNRCPCIGDYSWMGHSMAVADPVEVDSSLPLSDDRRWGTRDWNSWTDRDGVKGMRVLAGTKWVPDGGAGVGVTEAN